VLANAGLFLLWSQIVGFGSNRRSARFPAIPRRSGARESHLSAVANLSASFASSPIETPSPAAIALTVPHDGLDRPRSTSNLHLSAATAIGWEFRQPTGFSLDLNHQFVPCKTALAKPNPHGWRMNVEPGPADGDERLLVCLHATQDVANAMRRHCRDLPPARATLHIYPPSGSPERTSVDPTQANDLAAAIAVKINACRTEYSISQSHLYLACPWPLATLLGWHLSSSGRLVVHEPDVERGSYRAACELV
jgi:SMODS-associated and fused to various effectors sensor domain